MTDVDISPPTALPDPEHRTRPRTSNRGPRRLRQGPGDDGPVRQLPAQPQLDLDEYIDV